MAKTDYSTMTDERLMACVQSGDHGAFSMIVKKHSPMFYAAAYRMCPNSDEAEDIVQEAFLKLWKNPYGWDSSQGVKFTTWFYRVVTNQALDFLRKKRPAANAEIIPFVRDERENAQEVMQEMQEQKALESAICGLPERQRMALNLCYYEGLSNKEAAQILGLGVKALESLLMRAKAALKEELAKKGHIEDIKTGKEGKRYAIV